MAHTMEAEAQRMMLGLMKGTHRIVYARYDVGSDVTYCTIKPVPRDEFPMTNSRDVIMELVEADRPEDS